MKFLALVKSAETQGHPPQALMDAMDKLIASSLEDGSLVQTGGLAGSSRGVQFRIARGKLTATDGPFAEAKEVVGGYAILEAKTREEAIGYARSFMELHQRHWPQWQGECELREIQFLAP